MTAAPTSRRIAAGCLFLACSALAGCARQPAGSSNDGGVASLGSASASAVSVASTLPADAASEVVGDASLDAWEELCSAGRLPLLSLVAEGVALIEREPAAASARFERAGQPLGDAWLAYVELEAGRADRARELLDSVVRAIPFPDNARPDGREPMTDVLKGILVAREMTADACSRESRALPGSSTPCFLFERHPQAALAAFVPLFASSRDWTIHAWKGECALTVGEGHLPAARKKHLRAAMYNLKEAMLQVEPRPPHGSMWPTVIEAAADEVRDVLLSPETAEANGSEDSMLEARVTDARPHIGSLDVKVRRFRTVREASARVIGEAVCGVARARGVAIEPARCQVLAKAAITRQLVVWLASEPWTIREAWADSER